MISIFFSASATAMTSIEIYKQVQTDFMSKWITSVETSKVQMNTKLGMFTNDVMQIRGWGQPLTPLSHWNWRLLFGNFLELITSQISNFLTFCVMYMLIIGALEAFPKQPLHVFTEIIVNKVYIFQKGQSANWGDGYFVMKTAMPSPFPQGRKKNC